MLIVFDRDLDFFGPSAVDVDRIIPIVKQHPGRRAFRSIELARLRALSKICDLTRCITFCDTLSDMTEAISVRLDDESEQALRTLEAAGMSRSEAVRTALVRAAHAMRRHHELSAEVAALEADNDDRSEMLAVAEFMESLRAPR